VQNNTQHQILFEQQHQNALTQAHQRQIDSLQKEKERVQQQNDQDKEHWQSMQEILQNENDSLRQQMTVLVEKVHEMHAQRQIDTKMLKKQDKAPELEKIRKQLHAHEQEKQELQE